MQLFSKQIKLDDLVRNCNLSNYYSPELNIILYEGILLFKSYFILI